MSRVTTGTGIPHNDSTVINNSTSLRTATAVAT